MSTLSIKSVQSVKISELKIVTLTTDTKLVQLGAKSPTMGSPSPFNVSNNNEVILAGINVCF